MPAARTGRARPARAPPRVELQDGALPAPLFARLARAVRALGAERLRSTYQTTFWFDLGAPAALPEEAVLALLPRLRAAAGPGFRGVEWWLSRMRPSDVRVDFHQDCDEVLLRRGGPLVHPLATAVLFLNRCRGGLLVVTDAPPCDANPARAPDDLSRADLVRPWPNRLATFAGGLTHGVLDARGAVPHGRLRPAAPLRLALVANAWARRPTAVPRFAEAGRYARLRRAGAISGGPGGSAPGPSGRRRS